MIKWWSSPFPGSAHHRTAAPHLAAGDWIRKWWQDNCWQPIQFSSHQPAQAAQAESTPPCCLMLIAEVWVLEMASMAPLPTLDPITIRNKNIYLFLVGSFAGSSILWIRGLCFWWWLIKYAWSGNFKLIILTNGWYSTWMIMLAQPSLVATWDTGAWA